MATTLVTVHCKLFQMMPYVIILEVKKFHEPNANSFNSCNKKNSYKIYAYEGCHHRHIVLMVCLWLQVKSYNYVKLVKSNFRWDNLRRLSELFKSILGGTSVCGHTGMCRLSGSTFDPKYFRQGANLSFN